MYDIMVEDLSEDNPKHLLTEKQRAALSEAISTLTHEEKLVLEKRYQDYKTYRVIGEEIGVEGGKTRTICSKALRKLYHPDFRTRYRET